MKEYVVLKPSILNLDERIEKHPPEFNFNKDYCLWLISGIIAQTAYKLEKKEEDIWISVCSQIVKNTPYCYRGHLRYLCENFPNIGNVLFRKDYEKGRCFSYRLSPYYFGEEVEVVRITDKKMLKFLRCDSLLESNNSFKKNYNFLGKYFNEKLNIRQYEASNENKMLFRENCNYQKHLLNAVAIVEMANKKFSVTYTDRTDGRLHHQITRLSKKLRRFLSYDGQKLAECDLSASVPTVFSYLLSNMNNGSEHLDNVINPSKYYYRHYMFCKRLVPPMNKEISLFREKVVSGQFYEAFIEGMHTIHLFDKSLKPDEYYMKNVKKMFNREFDGDMDDLRKVIKRNFLAMFNARPGHYLNEEAEFNIHFQSILKWLKMFKKQKHEFFSYLTLQLESYFILEIVARQFNKKYRGKKPLFTLHDCLITTEDNIGVLHQFMKEKLTQALKFAPSLKTEVWE